MAKLQIWNTHRVKLDDDIYYSYKGNKFTEADFKNGVLAANREIMLRIFIKNITDKDFVPEKLTVYYTPVDIKGNLLKELSNSVYRPKRSIESPVIESNKFAVVTVRTGPNFIKELWEKWKDYKIVDLKVTKVCFEYSDGTTEEIKESEIIYEEPENAESEFNSIREKEKKKDKKWNLVFKILPFIVIAIILIAGFLYFWNSGIETRWSKLSDKEKDIIRDNMSFYDSIKD